MQWTEMHGLLLTQAFAAVLGDPEAGAVAFARCLAPEVVARLAADHSFAPGGWQVWRVAGEDAVTRSITGDRAVELRERKGDAVLLLVDTARAGAGMDGIYSAAREVEEAALFDQARRAALTAISRRQSAHTRRYAEEALKQAARGPGGREAVPPWTAFDFLCQVAAGGESPGTYVHSLGLWPIRDGPESDHEEALGTARRFVDTLLGPATAALAPAARIDALRLDADLQQQKSSLERFVHRVDAKPLRMALDELAKKHQSLWVGPLRTEAPAQEITDIVLTPWRVPKTRRLHRWSGLTLNDDDTPELVLSSDEGAESSTLEVRWKSEPKGLQQHAVDYLVVVQTSGLDEPLAEAMVRHSARKGGEKCRFSREDFSLDDEARLSAEVLVSVLGDDTIEPKKTDEFIIRFGQPRQSETGGVGLRVRTFSEGLTELGTRDAVTEITAAPPVTEGRDYVTLRAPADNGRHKSYRVLRPSLLAVVEQDWGARDGSIGRWVQKVRGSGERVGSAEFIPLQGNGGADWDRAEKASRRMATRFADTLGGVAQVYDERSKTYDHVKYYLRAWLAVLENGTPELGLANTVLVQSQSGSTIGLIVLPAHPLRMAWQAAYDNLVLHAVFEEHAKPSDIRKELRALDGAMFPPFLPNPGGGAFVFADTLGFHAVGMVPDDDPEPKAALAMLARALGGSGVADTAPTVGGQSATVAGDEIVKYLECHDTARLLLVHALRAGDGMTVARALGAVHRHYHVEAYGADDEVQIPPTDPVFALELYPSQQQRGVTGRFIADAREKRRSGAGVLAETDRWMLESVSLPGGVNQPRLRWARREGTEPETAAHVAVAFDTFDSRVCASSVVSATARPFHAFGLLSFYERHYQSQPQPRWTSVALLAEQGERHPSSRSHSQTLTRLQRALQQATTRHLRGAGLPALRTEIAADKEESLSNLHRLSDWVITLDRNAAIEYFDSPRAHPAIYDAYVIDCAPERDDLGCLQMITSTANFDAFRTLLDHALDQMGLSRSRRNAEFLMDHLKALSGRLAIRLTGQRPATAELVALAVANANCRAQTVAAPDDCWVSLAHGFIIPVDDVRDLLPPLEDTEAADDEGRRSRPDLVYVTVTPRPRRALAFRFIEVKYRRHLRAARAPEVLAAMCRQTQGLHERWSAWYGREHCAAFRAVRRAKLARVLRFYADKAWRHGLPQARHEELLAEIDRMVDRGGEYEFADDPAGDRGWVFCPDYTGDQPQRISVDHAAPTIFLFGAGRLPDSDYRAAAASPEPTDERAAPTEGTPAVMSESHADTAATTRGTNGPSVRAGAAPVASVRDRSAAGRTPSDAAPATPSVRLGAEARTHAAVRWPLTIQGNPHLLIAGLPGMGKTTCLINVCRQMVAARVRPIIFSYHEDIDEKLEEAVANVRFVDFSDSLGFHPLQVVDRSKRMAYLDVAAELRDIFAAIYPELGDLQGERLRSAVKDSFSEAGWGADGSQTSVAEPDFARFVEILRAEPRPDKGLRTLLARLAELEDYGFFNLGPAWHSLWEHEQPTVVRIHTTQNENLQRAFAALVFYGLYKDMFRRGTQERITHALIFDEAHRAARLKLIPTMAKECRKYGISLVLASQEARDFHSSIFSAIANYLVLRLTETDARFLIRNVASSQQERALVDRIKQMDRFKGLFFSEGNNRPYTVDLAP